jgi:MFS transporter, AAHS family, 4-hydroxybenzoate transporter
MRSTCPAILFTATGITLSRQQRKFLAKKQIDLVIYGQALTGFHYTVFLLCGSVALMDGYDSVAIGVTGASIAASIALDVKTFGPVFSAAQFGFMAGAFFAGPIADKAGRKGVLVSATVLFGVFSL